MSEELRDILIQLRDAIDNPIPIKIALWDAKTIGKYLHRKDTSILKYYACRPDFPKAIFLNGEKSKPLWKAMEVIAWTERQQA